MIPALPQVTTIMLPVAKYESTQAVSTDLSEAFPGRKTLVVSRLTAQFEENQADPGQTLLIAAHNQIDRPDRQLAALCYLRYAGRIQQDLAEKKNQDGQRILAVSNYVCRQQSMSLVAGTAASPDN